MRGTAIAALGLLLWLAQMPVRAQQAGIALTRLGSADLSRSAVGSAERTAAAPQVIAPSSALPYSSSVAPVVPSYHGVKVHAIQFRGFVADARVMQGLRNLITQPLGAPLDRSQIRHSLKALYATGLFSDLQVEVERSSQNELSLIFVAKPNYFFGEITVTGAPRRPAGNQLVNAAKLRLGELYSDQKMESAVRNILAVLADNGLYKAKVTYEQNFHPDTRLVDIRFHVDADGHARIGTVIVQGQPGYTSREIEHIADFKPGHTLTAQVVTKALQKLRRRYQKDQRLEAQMAIAERTYRADSDTVDFVFNIQEGPSVDIHLVGARLSGSKLKKLLPVYEEGAIDDDLLNEGLRNLRNYFQTQGYFDVRVNWTRESVPGQNHVHVYYHVDLGLKHRLLAVRIEGNRYFDTALIRERMQIRSSTGVLSTGVYSEAMLARDMASIESLYQSNGFQHVAVTHSVADDVGGVKGDIVVTVRIAEGPQTRVGEVRLVGNRPIDTEALTAGLTTIPGQPFSELNVSTDRETIVNFYFNRGFPDVQCEAAVSPAEASPDRINVEFTITVGPQVFVDRVLLSGVHYTRRYVVNREFQIRPGDPLNQASILESQRRLYDLGIFNEVDAAVQNPEGETRYKDVLFQVREARRWTFNYGGGFQLQSGPTGTISEVNTAPAPGVSVPPNTTPPSGGVPVGTNVLSGTGFSPALLFEVTRLNFRGRDHTVSFKARYGSLLKRGVVSYDAPRLFDNRNLRLNFSGLFENSRDVRTFSSERMEGSAQIQQVLTRRGDGQPISTLLWRYNYRRVRVDSSSLAISPELVPLLSKPVLVGMPGLAYSRDKRDDPLNPRKGNYTSVDFGVSARAFGSASVTGVQQVLQGSTGTTQTINATAANFIRLISENSTYAPIWHGITFARSTRIGIEHPFGNHANLLAIPLPERFFSGGASSLRGFALNQAGPRDLTTGFPLGGSAMFVNNLELRFPPPTLPLVRNDLSFVLFHDAGNVFQSISEMGHGLFRWYQPGRSACTQQATEGACRFDYMSQAAGLGIRYRTPIGPVRLDLSYNLNPPSFPFFVQCPAAGSRNDRAPCNALPPNALIFQNATLRHFNFFFSIGQSF